MKLPLGSCLRDRAFELGATSRLPVKRRHRRQVLPLVAFACVVAQATPQPVPDFGVMFNDDTKLVVGTTKTEVIAGITNNVVGNAALGIPWLAAPTIIRNIGYGSDLVYYPTTAGSNLGWRTFTQAEIDATANPVATQATIDYMTKVKSLVVDPAPADRLDPIRVQAEAALSAGKYYFLSYRMNDHVGLSDGRNNPLAGEFRVNSYVTPVPPDTDDAPNLIDEVSSATADRYYDYSKQAVRDNRLALIHEFLDRYADVIDGLQLDFERTYVIIPPGTSAANTTLITDFVTNVRNKLNALSSANGKPYYLLVRVPSTVRDCEWCGIAITSWIQNRLVDVVMPALFYDTSLDMPVGEFAVLANPVGAKVYPSVISTGGHYTGSRLFVQNPAATDSTAEIQEVRTAMLRGVAVNLRAQGAAGFEMFNYVLPLSAIGPAACSVLSLCPFSAAARDKNKTYAITARRENLWRDTAGVEALPLPVSWASTAPQVFHFSLKMHELFEDPVNTLGTNKQGKVQPKYVGLWLGCNGVQPGDQIAVKIRNVPVYPTLADGSPAPALVRTSVSGTQAGVPLKQAYLQMEVVHPDLVLPAGGATPGVYDLEITITSVDALPRSLTEINLGVLYHLF